LKREEIGDYHRNGIGDIMVKFDRASAQERVTVGKQIELTITVRVSVICFQGGDNITER
jgi:hypothetical protein